MYPSKRLSIKSATVAGIAASALLGLAGPHSQSSASQSGRVLHVRQLSRPLRRKGWRRATASSGGARCGPSRRWQL